MLKPFRFSFLLAAFVMLMALTLPHLSYAQSAATVTAPCDAGSTWQQNFQNNLTSAAQDRSKAAHNVFTGVPDIDVRLNYCMDTIKAMFDINAALSNPLGIIQNIVRQQILALVDQACQAAISAVSQVIAFGLSQFNRFCVPLPSLGNLGTIDLGLKGPPCNGTNLLGVKTTTGPAPQAPSRWNIWTGTTLPGQ